MKTHLTLGKSLATSLGATLLVSAYSQSAQAYHCYTVNITANDGCLEGGFVVDTPANIALDAPFGISDWLALDTSGDAGIDDAVPGILLTVGQQPSTYSGVWVIKYDDQNPWDTYQDLMITMRGGSGGYVAYSLRHGDLQGLYFMLDSVAPLDHARLWGAQSSVVPLPASVWLFGSGLIGLAATMRRSRQS